MTAADVDDLQEVVHELHGQALAEVHYHVDRGDGTEAATAHGRAQACRYVLSMLDALDEKGEFPDRETSPEVAAFSRAKLTLNEAYGTREDEAPIRGMQ